MRQRTLLALLLLAVATFPAAAELIDPFNATTNINTGNDGSSVVKSFTSTTSASGIAGVQLAYDLTSGNYVYMEKKYAGVNATGGDSFRFFYMGTGGANNIEFKVTDADGDTWWQSFANVTNTGGVWMSQVVPFTSLTQWTPTTGALDKTNLTKIEIAVSKGSASNSGGSGTVAFDQLELYQQNSPSSALMNDCNSNTNARGNAVSIWRQYDSGVNMDTMTYTVESGTKSPKGDNYYAVSYGFNAAHADGADVLVNNVKIGVSSMSVSGLGYITFYMRGETGGEKPRFVLQYWGSGSGDNIGRPFVKIPSYKALTTSWQLYSIPLADFTGLNPASLVEVNIEFNQADGIAGGSSGKIYVDEIRFSDQPDPVATAGTVATVDNMENAKASDSSWSFSVNDDGSASNPLVDVAYSDIDGYSGKALQADYSFAKGGTWFTMYRGAGKNILRSKGLRFKYAGTTSANNVEFKLTDSNKTVYFRKFYGITNTGGQWKTMTVPLKEFTPFDTSNTAALDMKSITTFNYAVTKKAGGTGAFCVANLELVDDPDFAVDTSGYNMLSSFKIPENPVSPNGDGVRDSARFMYTLKDSATVKLEIFNMNGSLAYETEKDDAFDGTEHTLTWLCLDKDGALVRNGLFFYKFTVKGYDGLEDKITNVIGVIR